MCRTPAKAALPPFPLRTVGLLLLITLADSIVITFLMPMVPYMVRNYGVAEEDVGFSAGSLASAYNLAGLFSGFFWGRISDTYGRRPVLLFGLLSTGATVVWFGLAGPAPHIQQHPHQPFCVRARRRPCRHRTLCHMHTRMPPFRSRYIVCMHDLFPEARRQPLFRHHRTGRWWPAQLQPGSHSSDAARGHARSAPRARLRLGRAGVALWRGGQPLLPPDSPGIRALTLALAPTPSPSTQLGMGHRLLPRPTTRRAAIAPCRHGALPARHDLRRVSVSAALPEPPTRART